MALAGNLVAGRVFSLDIAGLSLLALLPALGGMALGQVARTRLSEATFRRVFFTSLVGLGAYIVWRAVG